MSSLRLECAVSAAGSKAVLGAFLKDVRFAPGTGSYGPPHKSEGRGRSLDTIPVGPALRCTVLMARLFGAALVGLGLIFWFARDGSSESVRGVFIATIIGNTVGLIVVVLGTTAGTLNSMGWVAALIYLFGAAGSGYFVMARSPQLSSR
jgi:hypothetical protein